MIYWNEDKLISRDSPEGRCWMALLVMKHVHPFYCPAGDHFGVIVGSDHKCPMGCNA